MRRRPFDLLCWLLLGPWIAEPWLALPSQAIGPGPASRILHSLSQQQQQQPKQLQQVSQQQQQQQQQLQQQQLRGGGTEPLSWLLAERGPFHHAPEYSYFSDCYRQGFTTRYRIHREFARWRVNNVAIGRQEGLGAHVGLAPEFLQTLRRLGRRPSAQQLTDGLIRRYGTHVLLSATLGGEEALTVYVDRGKVDKQVENATQTQELLHQLTAAYFIDRDTTVRRLHEMQISTGHINVIETRKGPLGCSSYENLDLVSSVLIQTPENKLQLLGMQSILPAYLRERFVRAALGHVLCDGQGWFECRGAACSCRCHAAFPECNCPEADVRALRDTLRRLRQKWSAAYEAFENSEEFRAFVRRLPSGRFLSRSELYQLWASERDLQLQYGRVRVYAAGVRARAERTARRIYSLSRTCDSNPTVQMPAERPLSVWLERVQSLLYCSGHGASGGTSGGSGGGSGSSGGSGGRFSEESGVCVCPAGSPGPAVCQRPLPCRTGPGTRCTSCDRGNATRCGGCGAGYTLAPDGTCRPQAARPDETELFIDFESDLDLQDLELKYLLQKRDHRLVVPDAAFVSNELHLDSWFDPLYRRRMLISLRSNRHRPTSLHVLLGISLHVCHAKTGAGRSGGGGNSGGGGGGANGTGGSAARGEPLLTVSVNPFGGSHSESWQLPAGRDGYPGWEKVRHPEAGPVTGSGAAGTFPPPGTVVQCHNWTLSLGNRYKSFFETVHIYMRSRGGLKSGALLTNNRTESSESADTSDPPAKSQPPPPPPPPRRGFMKITSVQVFGYRLPFNAELLRSTVLRSAQVQAQGGPGTAATAAQTQQQQQHQQQMLALSELRARVNWLAPVTRHPPYDLFGCLLRHRVRLNGTEVARLNQALDAFDSAVLLMPETERTKLCT
ncbi:BMP/retinoic acid-inducible neural-specific protein 1-like [Lethenteron reissneri]|uniref:BMP/retinoic acid-inducible neural-specific protein 1-like n=1 Tax=Lethenteron reissneri TaxID=7753 RepID=UPI002AB71BA2|nr:BMP/retinoic acid-inducible neural-specific protein 1-like [Lethenteron reissneri]